MYTHANPNKNLSTKFPIKLNPIKFKILSSSSDTYSLLRSLVSLSWPNAQCTKKLMLISEKNDLPTR